MPEKIPVLRKLFCLEVTSTADYPPVFNLPFEIHDVLLEIVGETEHNRREHSTNFSLSLDQKRWVAGAVKKGTKTRESFVHRYITTPYGKACGKALVHAHTHVPPGNTRPKHYLLKNRNLGNVDPPQQAYEKLLLVAMQGLPSIKDARNNDLTTCGSVADVIASTMGHFLIVSNTPSEAWPSREEQLRFFVERWEIIESLRKSLEMIRPKGNPETVREEIAKKIAQAFRGVHTCYYNSELESRELIKIGV